MFSRVGFSKTDFPYQAGFDVFAFSLIVLSLLLFLIAQIVEIKAQSLQKMICFYGIFNNFLFKRILFEINNSNNLLIFYFLYSGFCSSNHLAFSASSCAIAVASWNSISIRSLYVFALAKRADKRATVASAPPMPPIELLPPVEGLLSRFSDCVEVLELDDCELLGLVSVGWPVCAGAAPGQWWF